MRESFALCWADYDKQSIRCHQSQLKNSNFKRENNHALLCQKYKAWIIWRNWQAWVTGANLDSYRCREWRLQLSTVHRSSCVTSCFLKSAHLFSLCDNPSIVMLLYALNMTRFLGFCRASVAFFVCSRRGQADFITDTTCFTYIVPGRRNLNESRALTQCLVCFSNALHHVCSKHFLLFPLFKSNHYVRIGAKALDALILIKLQYSNRTIAFRNKRSREKYWLDTDEFLITFTMIESIFFCASHYILWCTFYKYLQKWHNKRKYSYLWYIAVFKLYEWFRYIHQI